MSVLGNILWPWSWSSNIAVKMEYRVGLPISFKIFAVPIFESPSSEQLNKI